MRLQITKSANAECFFIVKSIRINGRNTNQVVERLGNLEQVRIKAGGKDPYQWAKEYAAKLTQEEKEQTRTVLVPLNQASQIPKGESQCFNGGYLFLQKIYSELKIKDICKAISRRREFEYDLNSILSRLVYCRIINPLSKMATLEFSQSCWKHQILSCTRFTEHWIPLRRKVTISRKDCTSTARRL